jgi:polysaccharide pyruvyl transferase WcaK-like protein
LRNIKVLHLASFDGNIGDNANHNGFYKHLRKNHDYNFEFNKLEIREFYWNKRYFDKSFVSLVNQHDLLVVGGGNYFELWVESSPTGTSIAIELDLLKEIKTPIFFNSLGVDAGQGASEQSLKKFRSFLDVLIDRGDFISVRNDGAIKTLSDLVGERYLEHVIDTPDAGFFLETSQSSAYYANKKYIAINVATDMDDIRFDKDNGKLGYNEFINEIINFLMVFLTKHSEYELVFVPHIFRDISFINDVLEKLDDEIRRKRVTVAPLLHGDDSFKDVMCIYDTARLVLGGRFHANVCSFGLGTPVIGLVNYIQIENLHLDLESDSFINISEKDFSVELANMVDRKLTLKVEKDFSIRDKMQINYSLFIKSFFNWLGNHL